MPTTIQGDIRILGAGDETTLATFFERARPQPDAARQPRAPARLERPALWRHLRRQLRGRPRHRRDRPLLERLPAAAGARHRTRLPATLAACSSLAAAAQRRAGRLGPGRRDHAHQLVRGRTVRRCDREILRAAAGRAACPRRCATARSAMRPIAAADVPMLAWRMEFLVDTFRLARSTATFDEAANDLTAALEEGRGWVAEADGRPLAYSGSTRRCPTWCSRRLTPPFARARGLALGVAGSLIRRATGAPAAPCCSPTSPTSPPSAYAALASRSATGASHGSDARRRPGEAKDLAIAATRRRGASAPHGVSLPLRTTASGYQHRAAMIGLRLHRDRDGASRGSTRARRPERKEAAVSRPQSGVARRHAAVLRCRSGRQRWHQHRAAMIRPSATAIGDWGIARFDAHTSSERSEGPAVSRPQSGVAHRHHREDRYRSGRQHQGTSTAGSDAHTSSERSGLAVSRPQSGVARVGTAAGSFAVAQDDSVTAPAPRGP